ncbi:MAG: respiratory nitrate reductase subunit gamma [Actinomycetota bacterium]
MDPFLFVALPYLAVGLAVAGGLVRYFVDRFSFSSHSSQFIENRTLFWGSVAWHYGVLVALLAHIVALAASDLWARVVSNPTRLYVLEVVGIAFGFLALIGLAALIVRRAFSSRLRVVTSPMDWVLLVALLAQVALGMVVAVAYRWGSDWYVATVVPWLESLFTLQPKTESIAVLPWVVKLHALGGFVLIALFPFTRLVHVVTAPVTYLWRARQVVIWNRRTAR